MPITRAPYFSPTQIGGCQLWLDGADTTTIGFSSGSNINLWKDKSSNSFNATNTGNYPTYSGSNLVFNGSQQLNLSTFVPSGTKNITIAAVWTCTSASTGGAFQSIIEQNGSQAGAWWRFMIQGYGFLGRNAYMYGINEYGANPTPGSSFPTFVTGTPNVSFITQASTDGTNFTLSNYAYGSLYGTQTYSGAVTIGTIGTIGSNTNSEGFTGTINEILVFTSPSSVLSTGQQQQVEAYLAQKWGLIGTLPQGHVGTTATLYRGVKIGTTTAPLYTQFSPRSIAGCQLWLDGADPAGTGTAPANGAAVSTWVDKSGTGNNATGGVSPTYSSSAGAVLFNGTSSYLQTSISAVPTVETVFAVFRATILPTQTDAGAVIFGSTGNGGRGFIVVTNVTSGSTAYQLRYDAYAVGNIFLTPYGGVVYNTLTLATGQYTGGQGAGSINGSSLGTFQSLSFSGSGTTRIGAVSGGGFFTGTINEILIYNTALTATQRQTVESYLAQKWGLTASLPSFSGPTGIPGCSLWLDGADPAGTGTAPANGATVSTWVDKSGNGYNGTSYGNPTFNTSAFNGKPSISFNGSTQYFVGAITNTGTTVSVFAIVSMNSGSQYGRICSLAVTNNFDGGVSSAYFIPLIRNYTNQSIQSGRYQGSGNVNVGPVAITYNTPFQAASIVNGTTNILYLNGTSAASGSSTGNFGYTAYGIGTQPSNFQPEYFQGYISEIVIYNTALTETQRQQVEGYLAAKWGLQGSLSNAHPYSTSAPTNHINNTQPAGLPANLTLATVQRGTSYVSYISQIRYYEVIPAKWATVWQPYLQQLAAANSSGITLTTSNITGGAAYTASGWSGAICAPNGNIYFTPFSATNILCLNPTTGITTNITGGATYYSNGGWTRGGVLAPNGNIYFAPWQAPNILMLNPTTGVTSNITGGATYTGSGWCGGVLAPNGNIYFAPTSATSILVLNPVTGVTSNLTGGATFSANGWQGGVLAPNGNIYFMPCNATNILVLNPDTGVTSNLTGGATFGSIWLCGSIAPNGNIYAAPTSATNILAINPITGVTSNITGSASYSGGWIDGTMGPDGNIYFSPNGATNILQLNTNTNATANITGSASYTGTWQGCALAANGTIYFAPMTATNILTLTFSGIRQLPSAVWCSTTWNN
jgi:Concanavalin A-like lectin/glucanases superfamily